MPAAVWEHVQSALAAQTTACSFDRAGYGASDPGPLPRDAQHIVGDLRAGVQKLGLHGPFILVGHSMAGYDMQLFANEHPDQVAGMVLVDPAIDGNDAALKKISPTWALEADQDDADNEKCIRGIADSMIKPGSALYIHCGSPDLNSPEFKPSTAKTIISEIENVDRSSAEVITSRIKYGSMPIIVLTAGGQFDEDKLPETDRRALKAAWLHGHEMIAKLSTRGQSRVIEGAPHVIHLAKPAAVIAAIEEVISQAR